MVSNKIKLIKYKRGKERLITRLRLEHCRLNHYLFKIGQHTTGKCDHCNTQEMIKHFLLEYKHYNLAPQIGMAKYTNDQMTIIRNINRVQLLIELHCKRFAQ